MGSCLGAMLPFILYSIRYSSEDHTELKGVNSGCPLCSLTGRMCFLRVQWCIVHVENMYAHKTILCAL